MSVSVAILDGPLPAGGAFRAPPGGGATLVFEGIVREREGDGLLLALDYEAYEPMARLMLEKIGGELLDRHGLLVLAVEHSRGRVPVGACSFRLSIASRHRKEALAAMDEFIDRLKHEVPLWKRPIWNEGAGPRAR